MPPFHVAYSYVKGGCFLKKLFPSTDMLQISSFEQIKYHGSYSLEQISQTSYDCKTKLFRMQIEATGLNVQHLIEEGFVLHCDSLQKLIIERIPK